MPKLIDRWKSTQKSILTDLNKRNREMKGLTASYVDYIMAQLMAPRSRQVRTNENGKVTTRHVFDQRPFIDYHIPREVVKRTLLLCPEVWPLNIDFQLPEMTAERQQEIITMQDFVRTGPYNMDLVAKIVGLAKLWLIETEPKKITEPVK